MLLIKRFFAFWIILCPQLYLAIGNRPILAHVRSSGAGNLHSTDSFTKQEQGVSKGRTENIVGGEENSNKKFIATPLSPEPPPSAGGGDESSSSTDLKSSNGTTHHHPLLPIPISVKVELSSLDTKNKDTPPLSHLLLGLAFQVRYRANC